MMFEDAQDMFELYSISPELTCECDEHHICQQCHEEDERFDREQEETILEDILYDNQKLYCSNNNLPLFAHKSCHHNVSWGGDYSNAPTDFGDMLVSKYGEEEALKKSYSHIISCPICSKTWCD